MSIPTLRRMLLSAVLAALGLGCSKNASQIGKAVAAPSPEPNASSPADSSLPPGIDISKLDDFERKVFFRVINREQSACGKGHSLLQSVKTDPGCKRSVYAVKYVGKLVDSGYTDSEIGEELQKRYREPEHNDIDISQAPSKGPAEARVTIVEFVDYECPHCRTAQALMRQVLEEYPRDVRVVFKHYPLSSHTNSRQAAEAAVAAQKQGKFWPYNDKVWANSDSLTPAILERIAKEVGLDVGRWRKDYETEEVKGRVAKDRADGVALSINSTPTIYVNGRKYAGRHDIESLRDWVDEALGK